MTIRTLMLGTVLACGVSLGAQAADGGAPLGTVAINICDSLGISGLTIGSSDTCLRISGLVKYEFVWGSYTSTRYADNFTGGAINFNNPHPDDFNSASTIDWRLRFEAFSESDFGQALAFLQLDEDGADGVQFSRAYVSIGDQTVLTAGRTESVWESGDSRVFNNFLGLFSNMGTGGPSTTGNSHVIQIESEFGNGIAVAAGLEGLDSTIRGVGVVEVDGDWGSSHVSLAVDETGAWKTHAGAQFSFENGGLTTAVAADDSGFWNALLSGEYDFDIFTLSAGLQYAEGGANDTQWGAGAQIGVDMTEDITVNLGSRYLTNVDTGEEIWQVAVGTEVDIAENLSLQPRIGYVNSSYAVAPAGNEEFFYGNVQLRYRPGGGALAVLGADINTTGAWRANFSLEKTF